MKFSLNHINQKLAEMNAKIVLIIRGSRRIVPNGEEVYLQRNDLIYVSCYSEQNTEIMRLFGVDHNPYEKAVIFGANTISYYLASQIEKNENVSSCCIIEDDAVKAAKMAEKLNNTSVIFGEMMSDVILEDAGFANADVSIAVTDRDKDNLLISLLASKNKETQALSLVNSKDYNQLAFNIHNNVIVDRSVITISGILHYLRKARISEAYSIGRGIGEFWEIRLGEDSVNLGRSVKELRIPQDSSVVLIARGDELIYDFDKQHLQANDKVLLFVAPPDIRDIERIFYL
jgi:trk system potassium uptake protein TrkA